VAPATSPALALLVLRQEGKPPCFDHHARKRTVARPTRSHETNQTLSGFWEVGGTSTHFLLDSGCEGIMISSDYARATGMKLLKLEHPVGLQLACVGSQSTINYGVESTIAFGRYCVDEYFDIANINYYDVILGTPFLCQLGVALEFSNPGTIRIGTYIVPKNFPDEPNKESSKAAACKGRLPEPTAPK